MTQNREMVSGNRTKIPSFQTKMPTFQTFLPLPWMTSHVSWAELKKVSAKLP